MTLPAVLHVNKYFYRRAGAETVFFATRELLQRRGHVVVDFAMSTDRDEPSPYARFFSPERSYEQGPLLRRAHDAAASVYSRAAQRALGALLDSQDTPTVDVAHLHNIYHQLTPAILIELRRRQIPTVLTVHDWKLACPAYSLFRDGEPCRACTGRSALPALRHRCIKGSAAASALAVAEAHVARWTRAYDHVSTSISPSAFGVSVLRSAGIDDNRIRAIENFLPERRFGTCTRAPAGALLYAGRLDPSKGILDLLAAWAAGPRAGVLRIAGDGPLRPDVERAASQDPTINYVGFVAQPDVERLIRDATAVVLPARWEENCPMIVLEAQAMGRAVISSDRGGLPHLVSHNQDGLVFPAGDLAALQSAMSRILLDAELADSLGASGAAKARSRYREINHYEQLVGVYNASRVPATG